MRGRPSARVVAWAAAGGLAVACSPGPRDVVPETRDVRVVAGGGDGGAAPSQDAYEYVTRRPRAVLALAESRNLRPEDAEQLVERLADELEACAARLEERGDLVGGAARVVAVAGPRGVAEGLNVRLAPGGAVAQNALLCLLAPVRAAVFPAGTGGGPPGIALEATWQPRGAHPVQSGKLQPRAPADDAGAGPR